MALNNQIISSISGNLIANSDGNITGANFANITSNLQTFISNNGTDIKSVSIQSSTDAGFTANYTLTLPVDYGTDGQILTTDGTGILSWETVSTSSISNGNSNVNIPDANGNVNISASGNANIFTVTGTGANVTGTLDVSSNLSAANILGPLSNGNSNVNIPAANGNVNISAVGNANILVVTGTGANVTGTFNTSGNITGGNLLGPLANGNSNVNIPAANGNVNISAVGNANILVVTGTGANITGTGNFSGNLSAANLLGPHANGNSNVNIPAANGNVNISAVGNANVLVVTGTGTNVAGTFTATGNVTGANLNTGGRVVATGNVSGANIIATGQITTTRAGNLSDGAGQLYLNGTGNNRIDFNTNGVGDPTFTTRSDGTKLVLYPALGGSSVDYAIGVAGATVWTSLPESNNTGYFKWYAGTTEVANITGTGNLTANNIKTAANAGFIAVGNNGSSTRQVTIQASTSASFTGNYILTLPIDDGTTGQALITDGSGILSWYTIPGGASLANGNSNINIIGNGAINMSSNGIANVFTIDGNFANFSGNVVMTGPNVSLGSISNLHIPGGTGGYLLSTDGAGNLSWAAPGGDPTAITNGNSNISIPVANGNVNISAVGNANILVVTGTGANITGTANVTGSITGGNLVTTGQITSTGAGNLSDGGGQLYLNGSGNNRIDFNTNGTGAPTFTDRSAGTKLLLFPALSGSQTDYAMGIDAATMWSSVPVSSSSFKFKWYGAETEIANLDGTGNFQIAANLTAANLIGPHANGNSNIAIAANSNVTITATGNATMVITDTGANITGTGNFSGNVNAANFIGALANGNSNVSIPAANGNVNISAVGNANVVTVTGSNVILSNAVPLTLIGNNGTALRTISLKATTNANFSSNFSLSLPPNVGTSGQYLQTDGSGNMVWASVSGGSTIVNGTSNVSIPTTNGNINMYSGGAGPIITVTSTGAVFTGVTIFNGEANANGNLYVSGGIYGNNVPGSNIYFGSGNGNIQFTACSNIIMNVAGNGVFINGNGTANFARVILNNDGSNGTGQGQLYLNGSSNNRIDFNTNGSGAPANTTRSVGTKIVLYPALSSTDVDYALGIAADTYWTSVPGSTQSFKWYAGITEVANLSGTGTLTANSLKTSVGGTFVAVANNGTSNRQITIQASTSASFTANYTLTLPVDDGTSGQLLATDGSGVLSWVNPGAASANIANGTSNVNIPTSGGNVNTSVGGNANILVVTGTGANIAGTLNATGNANTGNLGTTTAIITTGNITTVNSGLVQNGNSNVTITANANVTITAKSNATMVISDTGANITGTGNFSGNVNAANFIGVLANGNSNVSVPAANGNVNISSAGTANVVVITSTGANIAGTLNATGNVTGANFIGALANGTSNVSIPAASGNVNISSAGTANVIVVTSTGANIAGTLNASGNANVGNLGTTTAIITTGNITTVNSGLVRNGNSNVTITANANISLTARSNTTMVISDTGANITGTGNFSGNVSAANFIGVLANGNSNVNIPAAAGNVNISSNGAANVLVVTSTGVNVAGTLNATGNANTGNLGTTTAIITTGNITTVNTGLVQNGNSNVVITANANVSISSTGNANILVITGTGANVSGTANVTGNLAAGNITTVAITANGNIDFSGPNVSLGAVGNLHITGGSTGQVLTTDGSGGLSWSTGGGGGGGGANIANGTSNVNIPTSDGNVNTSVGGVANVFVVTTTGANITGTGNFTGNVTVANLIGPLANGNSNVSIPAANGNVNISAVGNANVLVITGTGANIAGTANVTGNIIGNSKLLIGTGTSSLTNPIGVFQGSGATYTQLAMFNSSGTGSADVVAYGNNGDDTQSWTDIGFTGNTFNDANYGITGAGDGYLFVQGNASFGGNLVIATGNTGTTKDILFATGGFANTTFVKARLYNANGLFSVTANISSGNANLGNLATANYFSGVANLLTVDGGNSVGFRNVPINSQSGAYTTVLTDSGKSIYHPVGASSNTWIIDSNTNVAYPLGTVLTFINWANTITIAINSDTLNLVGNGATGNRTLAANNLATAVKVTSTSWIISGSGLT